MNIFVKGRGSSGEKLVVMGSAEVFKDKNHIGDQFRVRSTASVSIAIASPSLGAEKTAEDYCYAPLLSSKQNEGAPLQDFMAAITPEVLKGTAYIDITDWPPKAVPFAKSIPK